MCKQGHTSMAYIKKRVNVVLLLLIAVIIASFIGFTTYYEIIYKDISTEYNLKKSQLEILNQNLSIQSGKLSETTAELQRKVEDKKRFDVLYTVSVEEKNALQEELTTTTATLENTRTELNEATEQVRSLNAEVKDLKVELDEKEVEIAGLDEQNTNKQAWLCRYNTSFC